MRRWCKNQKVGKGKQSWVAVRFSITVLSSLITKWHFIMKCAGQPKSCLFFAASGSPIATGHCGSFDKIWGEDTTYETVWETNTRGEHLLHIPRAKGRVSRWDKLENVLQIWHRSPPEHKSLVTLRHTQLWVNSLDLLRLQQGSVQHLLLSFLEQASWKDSREMLRSKWEF